jgi:hypothetical protein
VASSRAGCPRADWRNVVRPVGKRPGQSLPPARGQPPRLALDG